MTLAALMLLGLTFFGGGVRVRDVEIWQRYTNVDVGCFSWVPFGHDADGDAEDQLKQSQPFSRYVRNSLTLPWTFVS